MNCPRPAAVLLIVSLFLGHSALAAVGAEPALAPDPAVLAKLDALDDNQCWLLATRG